MIEIGIDVGGTFTDVVLLDRAAGRIEVTKTASTPRDQSIGILNGLGRLGIEASTIKRFTHGTTVATNTALERKGARVGLLTTAGFEDLVEIGRTNRTKVYDLRLIKPAPLVERQLRFGIRQRTFINGEANQRLSDEDVRSALAECRQKGVEAIAVCYLHSYLDSADEEHTAELIRSSDPSMLVSASSQVVREYKEYERFSTTILNAYVMPVMERYLERLEARLKEGGYRGPVEVMRSSGGLMRAATARKRPVETLLSGPAAGVMGAVHIAKRSGIRNIITYDMGGTSTDVALITDGEVVRTPETRISNLPLRMSMIDIKTVGAGGGSIARLEAGGILRVGPHSAGADPGPACYGKGGTEPTVTDANMVLGRLSGGYALGGEIQVVGERAEAVISQIGGALRLETAEMADGILRLVNTAMGSAVREISIQRGHDPRDFALVAFGGAGPMHACDLARDLGIPTVVVPPAPGNLCAFGLLATDITADQSETVLMRTADLDAGALAAKFASLKEAAGETLMQDGIEEAAISFTYSAEMRYRGQKSELPVIVDLATLGAAALDEGFFRVYAERYGHSRRVAPTEIVNIRVMAVALVDKPDLAKLMKPTGSKSGAEAIMDRRPVYFGGTGWSDCPVYDRDRMNAGRTLTGPAIVEEPGATTVIGPSDRFSIDANFNLIVEIDAQTRSQREAA